MPPVHPQAAGLAASEGGRWLAWTERGRVRVFDTAKQAHVAEAVLDLEQPHELVVTESPERLVVVHAAAGATHVRMFTLPDLRAAGELQLRGELRPVAVCGAVVVLLGSGDVVQGLDVTAARAAAIPVRGPIQIVCGLSAEQFLVGSRGKLEAWSVVERRPTHRLGLPLPTDPELAGVASHGRVFWVAAAGAITAFRIADGTKHEPITVGGAIESAVTDAASTTVVAAVREAPDHAPQLVAIDVVAQTRRAIAFERAIAAFCLIGSPAEAIAILPDGGSPVLVPLAGGSAETEVVPPEPPAADAAVPEPEPVNQISERLDQWRAQVQAAVVAPPPRASDRSAHTFAEPRSRSRAELYAWGLAARARGSTPPPPPPQLARLVDLVVRFQLDLRAKTLLALLYASWLDGDGRDGMPAGIVARVLGNDEEAWIEALAQGRVGGLGWIRSRFGRTRLRATVGRFLDEATPRIALFAPPADAERTEPPPPAPTAPSLWRVPDLAALADHARALAERLAAPVATIAATDARKLAARVLEARLHGALPIVVASDLSPFDPAQLEGPALVAIAGDAPLAWRALATWTDVIPAPIDFVTSGS